MQWRNDTTFPSRPVSSTARTPSNRSETGPRGVSLVLPRRFLGVGSRKRPPSQRPVLLGFLAGLTAAGAPPRWLRAQLLAMLAQKGGAPAASPTFPAFS